MFKFNFKDLVSLDNDLESSKKVLPKVIQNVLRNQLKIVRDSLRVDIPRDRGKLQSSFGYSVRKIGVNILGRVGFFTGKKVSASTAIAANVLQAGGAHPRKGIYLWIPARSNRNADGSAIVTPRQLIEGGGHLVKNSSGAVAFEAKSDLPAFVLRTFVKLSRPPVPIEQRVDAQIPEIEQELQQDMAALIEVRGAVFKED